MKAISLFVVLVTAHVMMLSGRDIPLSPWAPLAFFWQDAAVALSFAALDRIVRRPRVIWSVYGLIVAYVALNVGVVRVLPSPLTPAMIRAARGTLSDSISEYLTIENISVCLLVAAIGAAAPVLIRQLRWRAGARPLIALAMGAVALGPHAVTRVDTGGRHHNAVGALFPSRIATEPAGALAGDWRTSPFGPVESTDLAAFRSSARGRNIVLVILESVGAGYLRPYGAENDPMPNLTKLSEEAILFERAYAAYPESIKALFGVFCSRYPALGTSVELHARAHCSPLARELGDAGYLTALFHSGRFEYLGMQALIEGKGFSTLADAGTISGRTNSSFGIDETSTVEAILAWIDGVDPARPFFVAYLPIAGHHPYATAAPGPFDPRDERARYLNAIHEADAALGDVIDGINERGLGERTLFIVFGDHGEAFGQHVGNIGHSFYLYEENVRVPYLIAAPGLDTVVRADGPISIVDTAPTMLDLVGLPIPEDYEGESALEGSARMAFFLTDYARNRLGLYDACWKYLYEVDSRESELYHVCSDSEETRNVADHEPERLAVYRSRVESWAWSVRAAIVQNH